MTVARPLANMSGELLVQGYVLLGRLSRGDRSTVFEAQHEATRRRLAIKVTAADTQEAERDAGRLMTAWNVGRGLRHPHLVTLIDAGRLSDGRAWLVMERLRGRDLAIELEEVGRLPLARAVHIMRQVCDALQVLHRRGAVHRDVTPANIFLQSAGHFADHAKLIDLGRLAVGEDDPQRVHAPTGPVMLGTPLYLAPELATGEQATPATDVYSVGAVLYHLLAGEPPYHDPVATRLIAKHVTAPIPALPDDVEAPAVLGELIRRCLGKTPPERPAEISEVIEVLDHCLTQLAGTPPREDGRRHPLPPIPPAGTAPEWRRFADVLRGVIRSELAGHKPPEALQETLSWVTSARSELDEQLALAERHRAMADHRARARIASRQQLEARIDALDSALEDAGRRLAEAEAAMFTDVRRRGSIDEAYREALRAVEVAAAVGQGTLRPHELGPLLTDVRGHLVERSRVDAAVRTHRERAHGVAEQIALLMGERLEVARAHADVELAEHDEGMRLELLAGESSDAMLAAQRAFENASLALYHRCLELRYARRDAD